MTELALVVVAEALILAIVLVVATKRVTVRFRDLEVAAKETTATLKRVDAAVNNVPLGAPSLLERISNLEKDTVAHMSETRERLARLEARLARIEDLLARVCDVVGIKAGS